MRLVRAATSHLSELVQKRNIECDWSVDGKYQTAVTDEGTESMLQPFAVELDAFAKSFSRWVRRRRCLQSHW